MLRRSSADRLPPRRSGSLEDALADARPIVADVRATGAEALRAHGERLGDLEPGAPLWLPRSALRAAWERLPEPQRALLTRVAERIETFAQAQRDALADVQVPIPGGAAGIRYAPVERAGCYAPGGRFPLPSSVLMTALTARVAGVASIIVASPRPTDVTLAAAWLAGAEAVVPVGGAQAIAALAWGAGPIPAVDCIVGPGNRWVTAAKQLVAGQVRIDMLAGPSELVVIADDEADPERVAADLLAQAEHDPDAVPIALALSEAWLKRLDAALEAQLLDLPTAPIARQALAHGFACVACDLTEACALADQLAPEHLALHLSDPSPARARLRHYGALFCDPVAAEVLGDYGAGPNHVLPTGGTARSQGALSVLTFLRAQTWLAIDRPDEAHALARDSADLARLEGLEAHARAAELRLCQPAGSAGSGLRHRAS